jgi:release factor glutamine methyltransferase
LRHSFDAIVSNPPYIAPRDIEQLQTQVKDFEPRLALDGGEDGLDCYRALASQCKVLLRDGGSLICELGAGQFEAVREIFGNNGWSVGDAIFDLQRIARVLPARLI